MKARTTVPITYDAWLDQVRSALDEINMRIEDWQGTWAFDFDREYRVGTNPAEAAVKANRFWWYEQNRSLNQDCRKTANCWLPRGHQGECEPVS